MNHFAGFPRSRPAPVCLPLPAPVRQPLSSDLHAPTGHVHAAFVSIDRSDSSIDLTVPDSDSRSHGHHKIDSKPATFKHWREAFQLSRAKTDKSNSQGIAQLVFESYRKLPV